MRNIERLGSPMISGANRVSLTSISSISSRIGCFTSASYTARWASNHARSLCRLRPRRNVRVAVEKAMAQKLIWSQVPAMTGTPPAVTVSLLTRMLREAFSGPPGPWTYFTDTSPGTGVFGTIGGLSAAEASQEGGPGHTTIAGHVHPLSSSLTLSTLGLRGQSTSRDRGRSWTVARVDETGWADLRGRLRRGDERLLGAGGEPTAW